MKTMRLIILAALTAVSMSTMAQVDDWDGIYQDTTSKSKKTSYSSGGERFSTLYVQYHPTTLHASYNGHTENTTYNAFSLGLSNTFPLVNALMLEVGFKGQYLFHSESEDGVDEKAYFIAATIPANLVYSIEVNGEDFTIDPYAGLFMRGNIVGKNKIESGGKSVDYDFFKDDDMGGRAYKRFQFGFQAGVKARINNQFTFGGGYWMDIEKITDHVNFQGFDITLGYIF